MKLVSKLIKGLLLTAIFLATFTVSTRVAVNPADVPDKSVILSSGEQTDIRLADFFAKAYAKTAAEIQREINILEIKVNQGTITGEEWETQTDALDIDLKAVKVLEAFEAEQAAAATKPKPSTTRDPLLLLEKAAQTSLFVNNIFNPLIHMLTFQIGNFLNNDYIYAGAMGKMLQNIWVVSRNIVNIAFVLILLYIALIHIFKGDENTGELVKKLRIFVIMLIAVNFSWLATRLVLDAANVATQVVFSIPAGVKGVAGDAMPVEKGDCLINKKANGPNTTKGPCTADSVRYIVGATEVAYFKSDNCPSKEAVENANPRGTPSKEVKSDPLHNKTIYCWRKMDFAKYNQNNASLHLTFGMARVQNLVRANTNDDLPKTIIAVLFSLIIQVVFLVAFAALYVVLIARVAALWIFVAFSPFMVLLLFIKKELGGTGSEKFGPKAFAKWAFAPAKVGAVWAVGFIMITAGQATSVSFFQKVNADGVASNVINVSSLFLGMENMQEFIWLLLTVGIIWTGTFAMMSDLDVVGRFTDQVGDWGKRKARGLAMAPRYAPIIPQFDSEGKYTGMTSFDTKVKEVAKTFQPGQLAPAVRFADGKEVLDRKDGSVVRTAVEGVHGSKLLKKVSTLTGISMSDLQDTSNYEHLEKMLKTSKHQKLFADNDTFTRIKAARGSMAEQKDDQVSRVAARTGGAAATGLSKAETKDAQKEAILEADVEKQKRGLNKPAGGAAAQPLAKEPKLPPPPEG